MRALWSLDSRVRQWGRVDYWKDDLYKAGLMTTDLLRRLGFRPGQGSRERAAKS